MSAEIASSSGKKLGTTVFPLARIKRIIKLDKDINTISGEATFCIAQATELFLEYLIKEAQEKSVQEKRKTISYKDCAKIVKENVAFEFLEDAIPTTMKWQSAAEKRKQALIEEISVKKRKTHEGEEVEETEEVEEVEDIEEAEEVEETEDIEEAEEAEETEE